MTPPCTLAIVRGFLDTGTFSTLHASSLPRSGRHQPRSILLAWHVVTAVVASFFGDAVTLAANASIIALMAVVFPRHVCLLFLKLFGEGKRVVWAGSLFVVAFCGFPWGSRRTPAASNMVSFMLIPLAFVALLSGAIEAKGLSARSDSRSSWQRSRFHALSQPNGAFTFGIWRCSTAWAGYLVPPCDDAPRIASKRIAAAAALFLGGVRGLGRAVFRTVLAGTWFSTRGKLRFHLSRRSAAACCSCSRRARGDAAFLERRGAGGRHLLRAGTGGTLWMTVALRVRLHRIRYRRVDRRRGEAGAVRGSGTPTTTERAR